jgi:hypothetical protein
MTTRERCDYDYTWFTWNGVEAPLVTHRIDCEDCISKTASVWWFTPERKDALLDDPTSLWAPDIPVVQKRVTPNSAKDKYCGVEPHDVEFPVLCIWGESCNVCKPYPKGKAKCGWLYWGSCSHGSDSVCWGRG